MDADNLLHLEGDQSIITGFGRNPSTFEDEVNFDQLDGPQATSTVGVKKSRYDVIQEYISSLEDDVESYALTQVPCLLDMPQNTLRSKVAAEQKSAARHSNLGSRDSAGSLGNMTSSSLINVELMSGLSGSKFLVDHTQLCHLPTEVSEVSPSSARLGNVHQVPSNAALSDDEYDTESAAPQFTQQELEDLEADLSEYEGSDLSQGEDEECRMAGLGEKSFSPRPEVLRCGMQSFSHEDFSHKLSSVSQAREQHFAKDTIEEGDEGVPSYLLQPQESLLLEAQISQEMSRKDSIFQRQGFNHSEDVHRHSNVKFDAAQISARSTMFCEGLEESKLLSTSCNSLGSIGEDPKECLDDGASIQSQSDMVMDWFEVDQEELASVLDGESFHNADLDFLDEEEKQNAQMNVFMQEESCTGTALEDSCFSGIHEIKEITVRPSWILSPDRDLIGPGNRIHIEDYLKMRSEALGSLGDSDGEVRPDFGFGEVHSPPTNAKLMPLVEMSATDQMPQLYLQPDDVMEVEIASHESSHKGLYSSHYSETLQQYAKSIETSIDSSTSYSSSSQSSSVSGQLSTSTSGSSSSPSTTFQVSPRNDTRGAIPKSRSGENCSSRLDGNDDARTRSSQKVTGAGVDKLANYKQMDASVTNKSVMSNRDYKKPANSTERTAEPQKNSAQHIRNLISGALESDNAQALVEKIIQQTQKKSQVLKTMDVSELDVSCEVLQLRARREALMSKNQHKKPQDLKGKENVRMESHPRYLKSMDRQPLQPTTPLEMNENHGPVHQHMERLKVQRTGSAPLNQDYKMESHPYPHSKGKHLGTNMAESVMDESVRGIPYKSRILEDSQRSQLTSFHDDSNSGFDSSTPCAPRTRTKTNLGKASQNPPPVVRTGNQIYVEDKRPMSNPKSAQRPLPRMGLASSLGKMPGTRNFHDGGAGRIQKLTADIEHNGETNCGVSHLHSSRSETTVYPNSEGASSFESSEEDSVRSSSMPSGLQAIGISSSLRPLSPPGHCPQNLRQHHSQENLTPDNHLNLGTDEKIALPKEVRFSNTCVLGMGSEEVMTFRNPKQRWVQLSIRLMQETVNNVQSNVSALLFKPSYFVEPKNTIEIKLGLCSQNAGSLEAVLEVKVSDLSKGSGKASSSNASIHTVIISAQIEEPSVRLSCEGKEEIDFGIVPESCIISREITVINQSPQPIPAILTLRQVAATSPVFFWNEDDGESCKVVSPTHLAYELPACDPKTGPVPQNIKVFIKAPRLDKVKVDESGMIAVISQLQVELDTPNQSTIIISSIPIKAYVGVVHLLSLSSMDPFVLETKSTESCTASIPLRNSSNFPLRISIEPRDHGDHFTLHPNNIVIQPHSQTSANIAFTPKGKVGNIESVLLMCVEPNGKVYEVSIVGKSSAAPRELMATSVPLQRTVSAPVKNQVNLVSALESTKSRLVFGTVAVGGQTWQKVVLRNNCVTQSLSLVIGIQGSKAFQICKLGSTEGQSKMEAVFEPCQEFSLSVFFSPTTVEALSASLIFKPRGLSDPIKFQIPLQGYGGQSKLQIPDSCEDKPLIIRDISPQHPTMFHTALANTGDREMFLKLQVFLDKHCTERVPSTDISVQPEELVIRPKENRDVTIVVTGTPSVLARTPGCLAFLQIISGDEILRRRFRRLRNKEVKARRINDPNLLKIDWDVFYSGEKEVHAEEIGLPLQPEDAALFYNSCSRIQIQLDGERQVTDDASSTVFACLDAEYTMNCIADLSVVPDRTRELDPPPGHSSQTNAIAAQLRNTNLQQQSLAWDVFPQMLSLPASDTSVHTFFVVNFTSKQQMLEVTSNFRWLSIDPREAILPSLSSVRVTVRLVQSRIPQPVVTPIVETLQIMCENESRCATITLTPDGSSGSSAGSNNLSPLLVVTPPMPVEKLPVSQQKPQNAMHVHFASNPNSTTSKRPTDSQNQAQNINMIESGKPHRSLLSSTGSSAQTVTNIIAAEKCLVEVVNDNNEVVYPDTEPGSENFSKVKLRNLDKIVHSVKAEVTNLPFVIRHHEFKIKPGHYVSVPVYFRPQNAGRFSGHLKLTVVKDMKVLTVQLSGKVL